MNTINFFIALRLLVFSPRDDKYKYLNQITFMTKSLTNKAKFDID